MRSSRSRASKASSTVELVSIIIIMVPVALLAFDISFLAFGNFYNDAACREATRAASQQTNQANALGAATNALQNYQIAGGLVASPTISNFQFNYSYDKPAPPNTPIPIEIIGMTANPNNTLASGLGGNGGGGPNVCVETTMSCTTPAPLLIGPDGLANQVQLKSSYTFPLIYGVADPNDNTPESNPGATGPPPSPVP